MKKPSYYIKTIHDDAALKEFQNQENLLVFGIFNANDEQVGGFYGLKKSFLGLFYLVNPSDKEDCGLWYKNEALNSSKKVSFDKRILGCVALFLKESFKRVDINLPPEFIDAQPFFWNDFTCEPTNNKQNNYSIRVRRIPRWLKMFITH